MMPDYIQTDLSVLDRALYILEMIASSGELSIAEIQDKTQMKRSTAYRFVSSLLAHGYIEKAEAGTYRVGRKIVMLSSDYLNDVDLVASAQPLLRKYAKKLKLSMYMSILFRSEVIIVASVDINREGNSRYTTVGDRMLAINTAMGKCLLAGLSGEEFDSRITGFWKERSRVSHISDENMRKQILFEVRERGYVIDDGEFDPDVRCIAAPVYDYRSDIVAAICACGEQHELSLSKCRENADEIIKCASEISARIGFL